MELGGTTWNQSQIFAALGHRSSSALGFWSFFGVCELGIWTVLGHWSFAIGHLLVSSSRAWSASDGSAVETEHPTHRTIYCVVKRLGIAAARGSVSQTSKSAVSLASKPAICRRTACRGKSCIQPIWKSAIQQVWKPALRPIPRHAPLIRAQRLTDNPNGIASFSPRLDRACEGLPWVNRSIFPTLSSEARRAQARFISPDLLGT